MATILKRVLIRQKIRLKHLGFSKALQITYYMAQCLFWKRLKTNTWRSISATSCKHLLNWVSVILHGLVDLGIILSSISIKNGYLPMRIIQLIWKTRHTENTRERSLIIFKKKSKLQTLNFNATFKYLNT